MIAAPLLTQLCITGDSALNKPFSEWNQVFHGDATAHAIVDRLTERAEIFYLEGKSYRQTHRKGLNLASK